MSEHEEDKAQQVDNEESLASNMSNASRASRLGKDRAPSGKDYHCLEPGCENNHRAIQPGTPDRKHARQVHNRKASELKFAECEGDDCPHCES